jgi:oxygen-independent coproporphyrinogen-3 oxidase
MKTRNHARSQSDDLSGERILELSKVKLTALASIQSFFEDDLKMMNRAHNSAEAQNV